MAERKLPILLWILHCEDNDLKHIQPITRLDIMEGATLNPHPEGLFSTEIFGPFGSDLRDQLFGKIDLKVRILHPKIYRDLMSLKELYKHILNGSRRAVFNKKVGDFEAVDDDDPNGDTGYSFFMDNVQNIVFKQNQSIQRNEKIKELERWRHRWTMKNLVVLPAGLRDIEIGGDSRYTKDEINDFYYRILASTLVIVPSENMGSPEYDPIRRNLQNAVNDLYDYNEGITGGKHGFEGDKFLSRRVMDGTRNVITAMDATGVNLESPNVPGFDSTVWGLYQTTRALAPVVSFWLKEGPLSKLITAGDDMVQLVNKDTLMREWVSVDPNEVDNYVSEQGLMELIHSQEDIERRHRPVLIGGHYLALVYRDDTSFKVFDSIDELPEILQKVVASGKGRVDPITLEELLYYAGYRYFPECYNISTRYPGTDDNSTYPTRIYVRTTTTAQPLRERNDDWDYYESDDNMAPEWPMKGVFTYHDSHSPHAGRLEWSQAD